MDYFNPRHNPEVHRGCIVYTDVRQYPNGHLTKKVEGSRHHHVNHRDKELLERIEAMIEYEQVPEYNNRVGEAVYEENVVDVETDRAYPRRNRGGLFRY